MLSHSLKRALSVKIVISFYKADFLKCHTLWSPCAEVHVDGLGQMTSSLMVFTVQEILVSGNLPETHPCRPPNKPQVAMEAGRK